MLTGLSLRLLSPPLTKAPSLPVDPPVTQEAHPGFQLNTRPANNMGLLWGPADHYALEVDATNPERMIVEPGPETRVWYVANSTDGGYDQQAIRDEMGDQTIVVNGAWLEGAANVNGYGLRSDKPLKWNTEAYNDPANEPGPDRADGQRFRRDKSDWFAFKSAGVYPYSSPHIVNGFSPLHPKMFMSYGIGSKPRFVSNWRLHNGSIPVGDGNLALVGIEFTGLITATVEGWHDILFCDHAFRNRNGYGVTINGANTYSITLYNTTAYDCGYDTPQGPNAPAWGEGQGTIEDEFANRVSGMFTSGSNDMLLWLTAWDHNAWLEGYDPDGGPGAQPPNYLSHNWYQSEGANGTTVLETFNTRSAGGYEQCRGGGVHNICIYAEGQNGGNFGGGAEVILDVTGKTGSFPGAGSVVGQTSGFVVNTSTLTPDPSADTVRIVGPELGDEPGFTSGELIRAYDGPDGTGTEIGSATWSGTFSGPSGSTTSLSYAVTMGASQNNRTGANEGVLGRAWNGTKQPDAVFGPVILANPIDPANAAEATFRAGFSAVTNSGLDTPGDTAGNEYYHDVTVWNWNNAPDQKVGLDTEARRNEVTMGGFVDTLLGDPVGTRTTNQAIQYLRDNYANPAFLARDIWNFAAERFSRDTLGHTAGATASFSPNVNADGFRADTLLNWNIGGKSDFPVDGDNLQIASGATMYSFQTWRFADINFQIGGGVNLSGGLISATTTQGTGFVTTRRAGQFWLNGTHTNSITATIEGGRFGIRGTVSNGLSATVSGLSEFLITSGATCTIGPSHTLSIAGAAARCGFDGPSGTASLIIEGTLNFVADDGALPTIETFRSGHFGCEDLGNGVTGQPIDPTVSGSVILASGSRITLNLTGLAAGTYVLAKNVTDNGAELPADVTLTNGSLVLTV